MFEQLQECSQMMWNVLYIEISYRSQGPSMGISRLCATSVFASTSKHMMSRCKQRDVIIRSYFQSSTYEGTLRRLFVVSSAAASILRGRTTQTSRSSIHRVKARLYLLISSDTFSHDITNAALRSKASDSCVRKYFNLWNNSWRQCWRFMSM